MICLHCHAADLVTDANGQPECPACGDHPGPLRDADLAAMGTPEAPPGPEDLRAAHDAKVAAELGVTRHDREVGPDPRTPPPMVATVEGAGLRAEVRIVEGPEPAVYLTAWRDGSNVPFATGVYSPKRGVVATPEGGTP